MSKFKSSRGHFTTRRRRKLRKEIKESIISITIGLIGAVLLVSVWIGSVIQESEQLCPVMAVEATE